MTDPAPSPDEEALEDALHDVVRALVPALGLPPATTISGPRVWPNGVVPTVHPDRVAAGPYALACKILDVAGLALVALTEGTGARDAVTLEEGLAFLTARHVEPVPPC